MARISRFNRQSMLFGMDCLLLFLAACAPTSTPTPFVPPTDANAQQAQATVVVFATSTSPSQASSQGTQSSAQSSSQSSSPSSAASSTSPQPGTTPGGCTNSLKFLADLTIPDGTVVTAGEAVDKQWSVQNDGTCDWGDGYVLKLVSGDPMGTAAEIALYPARTGAQIVIDMELTAPQAAGSYHTVWQAYAPDGTAFDQPIYVDLVVQ